MKDARELIRKARRIEITSKKIVNTLFRGEYSSAFKGRGIEFSEVREYQVGDDIRDIDWNVTSRMDRAYVKVNHEERELSVILVLDVSASMRWGTQGTSKFDRLAELAAVFAISAVQNGDKVGAVMVGSKVHHVVEPRKGKQQIMRILRSTLNSEDDKGSTQLHEALEWVATSQKRKSFVIIISDYYAEGVMAPLKVLAKRHQVVPVWLEDPLELRWFWPRSQPGLKGIETSEHRLATHDFALDRDKMMSDRHESLKVMFRKLKVTPLNIQMDEPYLHKLLQYFGRGQK